MQTDNLKRSINKGMPDENNEYEDFGLEESGWRTSGFIKQTAWHRKLVIFLVIFRNFKLLH